MGFEYVELSHGTRITLVPGVLKAVEEGVVKVSSTHNFCPLPTGINHSAPNLFEPSARAVQEHDQWLRHTKKSIEFSAQVKAQVMVTHLGSVHFFWTNPVRKIKQYAKAHPDANLAEDADYRRILDKALVKLKARMVPYWAQVLASLEEVRTFAVERASSSVVRTGRSFRSCRSTRRLARCSPRSRSRTIADTGTTPGTPS